MNNIESKMQLAFENLCPLAKDVGTYKNDIPFLHPLDAKDIIQKVNDFSSSNHDNDKSFHGNWEHNQILDMFLKGYNPVAIAPVVESIRLGINRLKSCSTKHHFFLELGCGAGWSSLIMITELLRAGYKNFSLIIVDNSIYSIQTTKLLLEKYHISSKIFPSVDSITCDNEEGVNICLIQGDFLTTLQKIDYLFSLIWSNFGVSYLSNEVFFTLLQEIELKSKTASVFIIDTLDTSYQMQLNKLILFKRTILGHNRNKTASKDKQKYKNGKHVITVSNTQISMYLYDYLHWLLFNDIKSFIFHIKAISKSAKMVGQYAPSNHIRNISDSPLWIIQHNLNKISTLNKTTILIKK